MPNSQLIPQRDFSLLVSPGEGRDAIVQELRACSQLARVVAGGYVFRLSPVAMWGAAARGISAGEVIKRLESFAHVPLPSPVVKRILEPFARWGALQLTDDRGVATVTASDPTIFGNIGSVWADRAAGAALELNRTEVGAFKVAAAKAGWPVVDRRALAGEAGRAFQLRGAVIPRGYQREAAEAFSRAHHGVVLLPCGAGKTVVGILVAVQRPSSVLVLTPSRAVAAQWAEHFRTLTTLEPDDVGILERDRVLRPVTVTTYSMATVGSTTGELLDRPWGLVIYDEVQSLPADVFRNAAAFNGARRLGLSATLVREDGRERELTALIGPIIYDVPWMELEAEGWIAPAICVEVRTPNAEDDASARRFKVAVTERLIQMHQGEQIIVIGSELPLLRELSARLNLRLLTGASSEVARDSSLAAFRSGEIEVIAMSRIGSVGVDLPQASVLIQTSGTFGSRQEEAQRLGRVLRPAPGKVASFYSIVLDNPRDVRFAQRRQRFLVDQGYRYEILPASELPRVRR